MDLQNGGVEASSSDTITTDSGVGSKTEVDTLENWFKRKLYENSGAYESSTPYGGPLMVDFVSLQ